MQIIPVNDSSTHQLFLQVPALIYSKDPHWIQPLNKDIEEVFDEKKNKAFRNGEVKRWILEDAAGNAMGRIAAFVNNKYKNKDDEGRAGGIGFFDCINNQTAAELLFDNARHWLTSKGMVMMDGPINFGERDKWWGLLTEGFKEPLYGMNYNPPYYKDLFENYGFKCFYKQICMGMKVKEPLQNRIWERHDLIAKDPAFTARHANKSELDKYAADFTEVYNLAWAGHGGMKQLSLQQVKALFRKMKPVMDVRILWFAYYGEKPIGLFVNLPDLNQWFKHLHGKFGWWQKLKFFWLMRTRPNVKFTGLAFGIIPEFQGKGVDSFLIAEAAKLLQSDRVPYKEYEMQWIGDFNPKMLNIAMNLGDVYISRELTTYRYQFDPTLPFKRHPIL